MKKGLISYVEPGSAAYEGGILPGDCLIKVNGHKIRDIFDYRYYTTEENISLELIDAEGEPYIVDIEKDADEDPGIAFAEPMIDADRGCANNCIFCFIDQMPPGMRDTLYFKDDDTRLSFLTGNYVTLTNIGYAELNRLVKYRLSPINVSVHTTNPELRCSMLKHKGAGDVLKKIDVLRKGCITVNAQIVLCPGYNDGKELERTLSDLLSFSDCVASVSIVPVGLTKYREGLTKLRLPTKEEAEAVIDTAEKFRKLAIEKNGTGFVYPSDEFFIYAGRDIPDYSFYDEFPQLENGVGMLRLLDFQVCEYIQANKKRILKKTGKDYCRSVDVATGVAAFEFIKNLCRYTEAAFPGLTVNVHCIDNDFFGHTITVAGLITGGDLTAQLSGKLRSSELLITHNMLRNGETVFLDNIDLAEAEKRLGVKITAVPDSGDGFVKALLGLE
ncbi:MAG: DUF512 domain-containing protein [Clostridia bacterium]|nr:DUF512 domain-containing protein [Clostridia bacterium]